MLYHFKRLRNHCLFVRLALVHPTVHNVFGLQFSTRDWLDCNNTAQLSFHSPDSENKCLFETALPTLATLPYFGLQTAILGPKTLTK